MCVQLLVVRCPHKVKSDQRLLITEKRTLETVSQDVGDGDIAL